MSQQYKNGKYLANVHMPDLSNTKYEYKENNNTGFFNMA